MKCSHCHSNDANTHIKQVINGKREELFLCDKCARELGVMDSFNIDPFSIDSFLGDSFFGNLLGAGVSALNSLTGIDRCTSCGSSFNDIINSGKVGCADCYNKFEDKLSPSIEKLHGKAKHIGKMVTYTVENDDKAPNPISEIDSLKADLKLAIQEQRFEDAAVIRDKIKGISGGASNE